MTVRKERKLEQVSETAQAQAEADEKDDEHSEEYLSILSQEAEKQEDVALELIAEGAEEEDEEHSKEWIDIFSQEAEKNATEDVTEADEEEGNNICFADLWDQFEALEESVKVQSVHIQQVKLKTDEGGMGDHGDLLMCQNFLQLRRLHEQN
jgi:hypothetical protein